MLVCVCFVHRARETAGAARTRSSLRPPIFWGRDAWQTSGALRRENAELRPYPRCHRPRKRTIQYSEAAVIEPISRGVLDTPPSRGTTTAVGEGNAPLARMTRRQPALLLRPHGLG